MNFAYLLWTKDKQRFFRPGYAGPVDYIVFNAAIKDSLHRPAFLFRDADPRYVYNISKDRLNDCPCLFSAYYFHEFNKAGSNAVAVDIVYSKTDNIAPPLLLYKGSYLVVKKNKEGKYTHFNLHIAE
jgi:hypothetical protein